MFMEGEEASRYDDWIKERERERGYVAIAGDDVSKVRANVGFSL